MNYTKPEITLLASASSAIQGTDLPKQGGANDGKEPPLEIATPAAYEADE